MALDPIALKAEIKAGIEGVYPNQKADQLDTLSKAIADAVVNHLIANGLVVVTHPMGPGTGTIT